MDRVPFGYLRFFRRKRKSPVRVDVLTGYAQWARSYPAFAHNPLMELEEQAMLNLLPDNLSGKVCLDLACGSGRYMQLLLARQAKQVFGTDYSADMLAQVNNSQLKTKDPYSIIHNSQFTIHNSRLIRSSFLALPFTDKTFDLVTCGLAVGHEKNLNQVMAEMARVLRVGGVVIYSDFHPFGTLSGWQRSFTSASGDTFQLEHYLHLYSDHHRACRLAGLAVNAVLEPIAGEHAPPGFQQMPAVLVIGAMKM